MVNTIGQLKLVEFRERARKGVGRPVLDSWVEQLKTRASAPDYPLTTPANPVIVLLSRVRMA
jgi:hypothetical protein